MRHHRAGFACLVLCGSLMALILGPATSWAQQAFTKEIYQDFRGKKPLVSELIMVGPDADEVMTPEDGGLRITLPKTRMSNQPTGVRLQYSLAGDFEITAAYEILSIDTPPGDAAVGLAFNLMAYNNQRKFAKLGRFQRRPEGSVYLAECWLKDEPLENPWALVPTEARAGQLRLSRAGAKLRYLIADNPANEFREIYAAEFTDENLEVVRLGANNNGARGGIDVRLIDVRIRYGAAGQAVPVAAAAQRPAQGLLAAVLAVGLGLILFFGLGLAAWLYQRRRQAAEAAELPTARKNRD